MSDVHKLTGAYALDAVDDIERARFEQHLATCEDCRAEVAEMRETAALLAESTAVEPPASLRASVAEGAYAVTVEELPDRGRAVVAMGEVGQPRAGGGAQVEGGEDALDLVEGRNPDTGGVICNSGLAQPTLIRDGGVAEPREAEVGAVGVRERLHARP